MPPLDNSCDSQIPISFETFFYCFPDKTRMARYCKKTENLYDQLADIYEAASVVGVSRHFTKYDRLVHDSGQFLKKLYSFKFYVYVNICKIILQRVQGKPLMTSSKF